MENVLHIIGADLSKRTIDFSYYQNSAQNRVENNAEGFKQLLNWFKQHKIDLAKTVVVMEHTGLYSFCFENFLHERKIQFCKVSALEIKRSGGLIRGKSDRVDARRIASYGFEKLAKLNPQTETSKSIQRLKMLQNTRSQLVKTRTGTLCIVKEYQNIGLPEKDLILKTQKALLKVLNEQIVALEEAIEKIITTDTALKINYDLLKSVKSVGKVLATATIIKTDNFSRFTDGRKFACYCGTAPFEHTSGTSIKGKTRVSQLADKQMKTLLDLSAKNAIRFDPELKDFYGRRLLQGKSKMSSINIIRNKIIYRMFAVIKRQEPFIVKQNIAA